jgi:hypoxanthine phosphoribosyltransferase
MDTSLDARAEGTVDLTPSSPPVHTLDAPVPLHRDDIDHVLISADEIQTKIANVGAEITRDYQGRDLLLIGVLKGAFVFMADLSRHVRLPLEFDFMAVSSYGAATQTSGVVRILKDLDHEIAGRDVLLVEDIIDSGLTLSYLLKNLRTRRPASLQVCALLKKTGVQQVPLDIRYTCFEIPPEFVVGYGLDYAERFRNLTFVGTLKPEVYTDGP